VGGDQYVFEAGQYQAKDTVVKIEDTFPMAHTFDPVAWCERKLSFEPAILDNLQKNGIPFGLWDTYRERFNIKPVIEFEDQENCILDYISMQFINGEEDVLVEETLKNYTWQPRPRFSFIEFGWSCKRDLFITEIIFNEEEIFKAYRFIYQNNPMQEAILRIHVNKGNHFTSVFLENTDPQNHREVEFYKAEIKRYPLDEDDRVHFTAFKHENNDDKK
ncbi:MAG: hypothetical protein JXR39_08875, partial [Marinilabiliaceae bacterium]|nr:hypothetical protein [Marinilabiliaceae bacterium]